MSKGITPKNVERRFNECEVIVSKTDLTGKITYCNEIFCEVAGYSFDELIGKPHSIIRHPDMPRSVFKLLWTRVEAGHEVFAYVKNLCRDGEYYWVFAHVTPTYDENNKVIGYHSTRRVPDEKIVHNTIVPFYKQLLEIEQEPKSRKEGLQNSMKFLEDFLENQGVSYDEFILTL